MDTKVLQVLFLEILSVRPIGGEPTNRSRKVERLFGAYAPGVIGDW
jgi:hypothetical protein